jgi:hypothetical protein
MINLTKPKMMGRGDIDEIRRYLVGLVGEMQFALVTLENENTNLKKEIKALKESIAAMSVATADYIETTPDAMAYDGMAYSGEEMPEVSVEPTEEIIIGGKEDE